VKATVEDIAQDGTRKGLFRRVRRSDAPASSDTSGFDFHRTDHAVATVDDLARRMDELAGGVPAVDEHHDDVDHDEYGDVLADDPSSAHFDMQRAVIARANDLAAANLASFEQRHAHPSTPAPIATEAPVQQPVPTTDTPNAETTEDIEARMAAALQPVQVPTPAPTLSTGTESVSLDPTPAPTTADAPAAELRPTQPVAVSTAAYVPTSPQESAAATIGIDVARMVSLIEDEAAGVQHRIQLELRNAEEQAAQVVDRAEHEAERIREHGQAQARVLLGEVEEIISEAQATGEQILLRANEEASTLRGDATAVLHQAQTEARAIVETSRREGEQILAEQRRLATVRAQEAMREQDRLKDQIRRLEERRRQVLESLEPLISQLTNMMPATGGDPRNVIQMQRPSKG
jgi:F0F1-type ATP synthase membrane subunit b/b'